MNRTNLSVALGLAMMLSLAARAGAAEQELLAHGSGDMYWIARVEPVPGQTAFTQTTIQSRTVPADAPWKRIALLRARVVSLTNRGNQLIALQDNGDWKTVWGGGSSSGPLPEDGAKLILLAGDRDSLWGVAEIGRGRTPTSAAATQPATTLPAGTRLLYRLDQGRWMPLAPLPPEAADSRGISLALIDSTATLAALVGEGRALVWTWNANARAWDAPASIATEANASRVKLLGGLGRAVLWAGHDRGFGAVAFRDSNWSPPTPLSIPSDVPQTSANDITVAGQSIRMLFWPGQTGKIVELSFAPDGKSRGRSEIQPVASAPTDPNQFGWFSALLGAVMVLVLINSMRSRTVPQPESLEQAKIALAPLGRRFIAAFIDAIPIIGTTLVMAFRLQSPEPFNPEIYAQFQIPLAVATGVYVVHTLASELLWGWSIGKRICGLRVAMIDGGPPTRRAIIIRNLLRIIDVFFGFPPLLVLISPLRQRVGDLAAETIVVVAQPEKPKGES